MYVKLKKNDVQAADGALVTDPWSEQRARSRRPEGGDMRGLKRQRSGVRVSLLLLAVRWQWTGSR